MNHCLPNLEKVTAYIKKEYLFIGVLVVFIVVATAISSGFSRDSVAYTNMFAIYGMSGWGVFTTEMLHLEVFFLAVSKILFSLGLGAVFLFLLYSSISVSVKFYLINKRSKEQWLSLAFFASYFFILHDSTQIRIGIAVAFVYLGLSYLAEGKRLLFSVIVILSALMFHFSSIVFIVMLFFTSKKSWFWLLGMVFFAILLYPVNLHAIFLELVGDSLRYLSLHGTLLYKLYVNLLAQRSDVILGIFRPTALLVYFCAIVMFQYRNKFNPFEGLCYNALIISIFLYILLKDFLIFQVRFADIFGFSLVFLVPYVHRAISSYIGEKAAYLLLMAFFLVHLIKFTLYDKMLIL